MPAVEAKPRAPAKRTVQANPFAGVTAGWGHVLVREIKLDSIVMSKGGIAMVTRIDGKDEDTEDAKLKHGEVISAGPWSSGKSGIPVSQWDWVQPGTKIQYTHARFVYSCGDADLDAVFCRDVVAIQSEGETWKAAPAWLLFHKVEDDEVKHGSLVKPNSSWRAKQGKVVSAGAAIHPYSNFKWADEGWLSPGEVFWYKHHNRKELVGALDPAIKAHEIFDATGESNLPAFPAGVAERTHPARKPPTKGESRG